MIELIDPLFRNARTSLYFLNTHLTIRLIFSTKYFQFYANVSLMFRLLPTHPEYFPNARAQHREDVEDSVGKFQLKTSFRTHT